MSAQNWAPWAFGKVAKSFEVLVLADGDLRARLPAAWNQGLCAINPEMMPTEETRKLADELIAFFTRGSGDEYTDEFYRAHHGIAYASVRRRRSATLRPIADKLWLLYDKLGQAVR